MSARLLTPSEIYRRKQRLWRAYCQWAERVRRAFFPDTNGVSLYMHNWYRCGSDKKLAALADWVDASTYARQQRLSDKLEVRGERNDHLLNHGPHFEPMWCDYCQGRKVIVTNNSHPELNL